MGGRGTLSPQAKQRAARISRKALDWAKSKIGSTQYSTWTINGVLVYGTSKCNLFVEHAFNKGNPQEKPFPFTPSKQLLAAGIGRMRNYSADEIYNGRLQNFKLVKTPKPGDIATNSIHVGIVSGKGTTISASTETNTVVENSWGFRTKSKKPSVGMRFFRYTGDDK